MSITPIPPISSERGKETPHLSFAGGVNTDSDQVREDEVYNMLNFIIDSGGVTKVRDSFVILNEDDPRYPIYGMIQYGDYIIAAKGSALKKIKISDGVLTDLDGDYSNAEWSFINYQDTIYGTNGLNRTIVYDNENVRKMGLFKPIANFIYDFVDRGPLKKDDIYNYKYTYVYKKTNKVIGESNGGRNRRIKMPSDNVSVRLVFNPEEPFDSNYVFARRIYRMKEGTDDLYYFIGEVPIELSSWIDNKSDDELLLENAIVSETIPEDHDLPPLGRIILEYHNIPWIFGLTNDPGAFRFGKVGYGFEIMPAKNYQSINGIPFITGAIKFRGEIIVGGEDKLVGISGYSLDTLNIRPISDTYGFLGHKGMIVVGNWLYFASKAGLCRTDGNIIQVITKGRIQNKYYELTRVAAAINNKLVIDDTRVDFEAGEAKSTIETREIPGTIMPKKMSFNDMFLGYKGSDLRWFDAVTKDFRNIIPCAEVNKDGNIVRNAIDSQERMKKGYWDPDLIDLESEPGVIKLMKGQIGESVEVLDLLGGWNSDAAWDWGAPSAPLIADGNFSTFETMQFGNKSEFSFVVQARKRTVAGTIPDIGYDGRVLDKIRVKYNPFFEDGYEPFELYLEYFSKGTRKQALRGVGQWTQIGGRLPVKNVNYFNDITVDVSTLNIAPEFVRLRAKTIETGGTVTDLILDCYEIELSVKAYVNEGYYETPIISYPTFASDFPTAEGWGHVRVIGEETNGTISIESATAVGDGQFSKWRAVSGGGNILSPPGDRIIFRIKLTRSNIVKSTTPIVNSIIFQCSALTPSINVLDKYFANSNHRDKLFANVQLQVAGKRKNILSEDSIDVNYYHRGGDVSRFGINDLLDKYLFISSNKLDKFEYNEQSCPFAWIRIPSFNTHITSETIVRINVTDNTYGETGIAFWQDAQNFIAGRIKYDSGSAKWRAEFFQSNNAGDGVIAFEDIDTATNFDIKTRKELYIKLDWTPGTNAVTMNISHDGLSWDPVNGTYYPPGSPTYTRSYVYCAANNSNSGLVYAGFGYFKLYEGGSPKFDDLFDVDTINMNIYRGVHGTGGFGLLGVTSNYDDDKYKKIANMDMVATNKQANRIKIVLMLDTTPTGTTYADVETKDISPALEEFVFGALFVSRIMKLEDTPIAWKFFSTYEAYGQIPDFWIRSGDTVAELLLEDFIAIDPDGGVPSVIKKKYIQYRTNLEVFNEIEFDLVLIHDVYLWYTITATEYYSPVAVFFKDYLWFAMGDETTDGNHFVICINPNNAFSFLNFLHLGNYFGFLNFIATDKYVYSGTWGGRIARHYDNSGTEDIESEIITQDYNFGSMNWKTFYNYFLALKTDTLTLPVAIQVQPVFDSVDGVEKNISIDESSKIMNKYADMGGKQAIYIRYIISSNTSKRFTIYNFIQEYSFDNFKGL